MPVRFSRNAAFILAFMLTLVSPSFAKTPKSQQAAQEPSPKGHRG